MVDRPALSDFHTPAIVDRGAVVAAIGSGGGAPVMVSLLRAEIEARIPAGAGEIAALLAHRRPALRAALPDLSDRRSFFRAVLAGEVATAAADGDLERAGRLLDAAIARGWRAIGGVDFIVAPARADHLSLRAVRSLNIADVVVEGAGSRAVLDSHARRDAERMVPSDVSASILTELAAARRRVAVVDRVLDTALLVQLRATTTPVEVLEPAPDS